MRRLRPRPAPGGRVADHKRVRSALTALPDVLLDDEAIIWLTDAEHVGRPGVLAITIRAFCFVPVDEERDPERSTSTRSSKG